MPFEQNLVLDQKAEVIYGKYITTFHSVNGEVLAHLFQKGDQMIAHVQMPTGLKSYEVTDPYWDELHQFARDQGFEDRLRIIIAA
jgi:hypothetical protein